MKNEKSFKKALCRAFGEDTDHTRLWMTIVRDDQNEVFELLNSADEKSINKRFSWSKFLRGGTASPLLQEAVLKEEVGLIKALTDKGAKWDDMSTCLVAALIVCKAKQNPPADDLAELIDVCLSSGINWNKGMFYEDTRHDSRKPLGTPRIFLMDQLEEQAFSLGLFPKKSSAVQNISVSPADRTLRITSSNDDIPLDDFVRGKRRKISP